MPLFLWPGLLLRLTERAREVERLLLADTLLREELLRDEEALLLRGVVDAGRDTALRLLLLLCELEETLRAGAELRLDDTLLRLELLLRFEETLLRLLLLGELLRLTDEPERDELLLPAGRCATTGMQARAKTTRNAIIFLLLFMMFSFLCFLLFLF